MDIKLNTSPLFRFTTTKGCTKSPFTSVGHSPYVITPFTNKQFNPFLGFPHPRIFSTSFNTLGRRFFLCFSTTCSQLLCLSKKICLKIFCSIRIFSSFCKIGSTYKFWCYNKKTTETTLGGLNRIYYFFNIPFNTKATFAGLSANLLIKYPYQSVPYGTYTRTVYPSLTNSSCLSGLIP